MAVCGSARETLGMFLKKATYIKDRVKIYCFQARWNEDCRELDAYRIRGFDDL